MSLGGALNIGRTGLLANRAAIETVGHNLANVSTPGYHRRTVSLVPVQGGEISQGVFLGRGVQIENIVRNVSEALETRLRSSISDSSASQVKHELLAQIEAVQNEFTDVDLSSNLSQFFDAWSELANTPDDFSKRTLVIEQGNRLASFMTDLRSQLSDLRQQLDDTVENGVDSVNDLLDRIASLNADIAVAESASGGAHSLRDERDRLLGELSGFMDISVNEQPSGMIDVFVGSIPLILNDKSRGVDIRRTTVGDDVQITLETKADGSPIVPRSGTLGALIEGREQSVNNAIEDLDEFANTLIYQVNRLHSEGQGTQGFSSITGTTKVEDATVSLLDPAALIGFTPEHGSFQIHVKHKASGQLTSSRVDVDLDGIDSANDTSLQSLVASISAVADVTASITPDGRLQISSDDPNLEISFSDDTSGVLAALGINTYFSGDSALDIAVRSDIADDPGLLAVAQNHVPGDNSNALAIAQLRDQDIEEQGGISITEMWNRQVEEIASRVAQAEAEHEADQVVAASLDAQFQAVSGVNTDEEAINLLAYQRAYQGSAQFLSAVDEMIQTLLQLI